MKKLTYNSKIVKKVVLWTIVGLLVFWLGYAMIVSFTNKKHMTTKSSTVETDIPSGNYQDYIKTKLDLDLENNISDKQEYFDELKDTSLTNDIAVSGNDAVLVNGDEAYNTNWPTEEDKEVKNASGELVYADKLASMNGKTGCYTDESTIISFTIDGIPERGFYYIKISYFIPKGKGSAVKRKVLVNNEILFDNLLNYSFSRLYRDASEIIQDINGNDIKPSQKEIFEYHEDEYLHDETGYIVDPYLIYLKEGQNVITFEGLKENLVITELKVSPIVEYSKTMLTYADYYETKCEETGTDKDTVTNVMNKYEAENLNRFASSPTLYPIADRTSATSYPNDPVRTKYNAIGGSKWTTPGDIIGWDVEVEEEGFYLLAFRSKQDLSRGLFSTRKLLVDGNLPFKEATNCRFYYDSEYSLVTVGGANDEKYYIYLEEGKHQISLQATLGDYGSEISEVTEIINMLNDLYLRIIVITTTNPDDYQDYNLYGDNSRLVDEKGNPIDMIEVFDNAANRLNEVSKRVTELTGEKSSLNNVLDKLVLQIGGKVNFGTEENPEIKDVGGFASKPRNVTKDLAAFKTNLSSLGTWILDIQKQTLTIESFYLYTDDQELGAAEDNFFKGLWFSIRGFFGSFFFDYESIGVTSTKGFDREIEVWFLTSDTSGREQANVIKSLIDQNFIYNVEGEKDYECNVILKVLAPGVLLPATLAGTGPDVAINVGEGLPINYALRGAVYNLSKFDDFEKAVSERFTAEEMIPMYLYNEVDEEKTGYYGFPNAASFLVMFYRSDIFEKNGWEVPKTWDDVFNLVVELQVQNLDFYLPLEGAGSQIFSTILYQMGGRFYNDRQTASDFSTEVAKKAFEQWCSFFTDYSFEKSANFTNRFRSGEMPIGISSYTLYNTLSVFAAVIAGKWSFAPLPGVKNADGTINNRGALGITSSIILENAKDKEASWDFLKWWTSTETQELFAVEIESILGSGARHNTANINALESLPWSKDEYSILMSQFKNAFGIPEVAGGYYIGRNLENAIREVINNKSNPRETFAEYVELINSEITRKREEFKMPTE